MYINTVELDWARKSNVLKRNAFKKLERLTIKNLENDK